jgi:outer membrane protein assembly factor BamB
VGSNRDFVYAVDIASGLEKWRFKADAPRRPAVRDGVVYFSDFSKLYAIESLSGNLKWKIKVPEGVEQDLAISRSSVFFSAASRKFYAVDVSDGQVRWSINTKPYPFEPIIAGNRVFVGGREELLMLDTETGHKYETVRLGPMTAHTPTLLDDTAIIYNGDGFFFAITK